eukprot:s7129_g1.t1
MSRFSFPWMCLNRFEQLDVRPKANDAFVPRFQLSSADVHGHSCWNGSRAVGSFKHQNTRNFNLIPTAKYFPRWCLVLARSDSNSTDEHTRRNNGSALDQSEVVRMGFHAPQPEAPVHQSRLGELTSLLHKLLPDETVSKRSRHTGSGYAKPRSGEESPPVQ